MTIEDLTDMRRSGCGFADGRLGCLCLEMREEIYIS